MKTHLSRFSTILLPIFRDIILLCQVFKRSKNIIRRRKRSNRRRRLNAWRVDHDISTSYNPHSYFREISHINCPLHYISFTTTSWELGLGWQFFWKISSFFFFLLFLLLFFSSFDVTFFFFFFFFLLFPPFIFFFFLFTIFFFSISPNLLLLQQRNLLPNFELSLFFIFVKRKRTQVKKERVFVVGNMPEITLSRNLLLQKNSTIWLGNWNIFFTCILLFFFFFFT
mmetsp:Transcript_41274/g.57483  ORF Transcript_41274/g.57483 Transcript_41274/m.57483 type:complete len:226 (-) Transcript_41274:607-1284(-)